MGNHNKYWNGLEELESRPEVLESRKKEFKESIPFVDELSNDASLNVKSSRRDFLKIFGFGITAATLAACVETPVKKAIPLVNKPEDMTPGVANYFATTCGGCAAGCGVLVKTREGRPIKIEGNESSHVSHGATCAIGQATVLSLYDSSRLLTPKMGGNEVAWDKVDADMKALLATADGSKVRILSRTVHSPSTNRAIQNLLTHVKGGKHVTYEPLSAYGIIKAHQMGFGKAALPTFHFEKAMTIVSFGADFLGTWISPVEFTKGYARNRKLDREHPKMSWHLQIESRMSLTGSNADLRIPVKPSAEGEAIIHLYNLIAEAKGGEKISGGKDVAAYAIAEAAKQLLANQGASLVVCGSNDWNSQLLVARINHLLGNYGHTLDLDITSNQNLANDEEFEQLLKDMEGKGVDTLIILGGNPVYDSYDGARFEKALASVTNRVYFTLYENETAAKCGTILPDTHYLESWNDANPRTGEYAIQQPTINPIWPNTRTAQTSLLKWAANDTAWYDFIRSTWETTTFPLQNKYILFADFWNATVMDGAFHASSNPAPHPKPEVADAKAKKDDKKSKGKGKDKEKDAHADAAHGETADMAAAMVTAVAFTGNWIGNAGEAGTVLSGIASKSQGGELVIYPKVTMMDGSEANNPWLQEVPDPITKVTWDNYINISYADGKAAGLKDGNIVTLTIGTKTITLPVVLQPGQANGTYAIAMGYGRTAGGKLFSADTPIGQNVNPMLRMENGGVQYWTSGASIGAASGFNELAKSQTYVGYELEEEGTAADRQLLEKERIAGTILKETLFSEYQKDRTSGNQNRLANSHMISLWETHDKKGHHWAMAIDLNSCTGCGNCIVSCNAENNIPVVGRDEIRRRRDLHWMRIDRYYAGDPSDQEGKLVAMHQPMLCQHCNNAPCETVCPVLATMHSDEGLNQQAYNRCVGTRYCANNCPYKVRRFNWFSYYENSKFDYNMNDRYGKLQLNPDITVRARGVMEKCSMCVQRIQEKKLKAKVEMRPLKDGEIRTACQSTCPANAIVFGDINDSSSEIYKLYHNERVYHALEEVKTLPNVAYLTKVRNRASSPFVSGEAAHAAQETHHEG